jgi:hypothetical protein
VPTPNDEEFELYLKEFRPVAPAPLPVVGKPRRPFWMALGLAAAAAAVLVVVTLFGIRPERVGTPASNPQLLTIADANQLLANAPSFKTAVDEIAFASRGASFPEGTRSVIDVLGQENLK